MKYIQVYIFSNKFLKIGDPFGETSKKKTKTKQKPKKKKKKELRNLQMEFN
jgi:hypothetical protein